MGDHYDLLAAFAATDIFGNVSRKSLRRIAGSAKVVTHPAGQVVVNEGRSGVGFHLVLEGTASVKVGRSKRDDIGPGGYFGEISMIDRLPRSADVTAKTDLVTASVSAWAFRPILDEDPKLAKALLLTLCARLRASERGADRTGNGR